MITATEMPEEHDQLNGLPAGVVLTFEEIHGHGDQPCRQGSGHPPTASRQHRPTVIDNQSNGGPASSLHKLVPPYIVLVRRRRPSAPSRCSACSISNKLAAWKLNMLAMITVGNISRWVL